MIVALLLQGLALIVVGLAMHHGNYVLIVVALVVWGSGLAFVAVSARRALMSSVPMTQRGQAGGVILTAQMLGGTVGILCGTFLVASGDFGSIFLTTGGLLLAVLLITWLTIERKAQAA